VRGNGTLVPQQIQFKGEQVAALKVRPGIDGVLQQIGDREMLQAGWRLAT
jgi:hypothetical protein